MADATQAPPGAPPQTPIQTAYQDSGAAGHSVQVTRNVPPKRVQVVPGHEVVYAGRLYTSEDEPFLIGEGPAADQLAFSGHVVVVSHEEVDAWNGAEGAAVRKRGLAWVQSSEALYRTRDHHGAFARGEMSVEDYTKALNEAHADSKPTHDHGFRTYRHADPDNPIPMDVTQHRQQVAQRHMLEGRAATDGDFTSTPAKPEEGDQQ